jgi:hypothetical protein
VPSEKILMDATLGKFNFENPYSYIIDNYMFGNATKISSLNGVPKMGLINCVPQVNLGPYEDYTSYAPVKTGFDWNGLANTVVTQVLPQVLNPTLAQNQNNPTNAILLAQQIAQNQQALATATQQQTQAQNQGIESLLSNPLVLAAAAYFIYTLSQKSK